MLTKWRVVVHIINILVHIMIMSALFTSSFHDSRHVQETALVQACYYADLQQGSDSETTYIKRYNFVKSEC